MVLGNSDSERPRPFAYRTITFCDRSFQNVRLRPVFCNSVGPIELGPRRNPTTPRHNALELTCARFGLFPVRSPLLGESRLLSFPPGTEMVHFPGFASSPYGFR